MVLHIELHAFEGIDEGLLEQLSAALKGLLGLEVTRGAALPVPDAYDRGRGQFRSGAFLAALEGAGARGEPRLVLGVTDLDLFVPELNFVFGQAEPKGGMAVISVARLGAEHYGGEPDPGLLLGRMLKEAVHELGHLLGLGHCARSGCVMFFSSSITDTDGKGPGFCPDCGLRIRSRIDAVRQK